MEKSKIWSKIRSISKSGKRVLLGVLGALLLVSAGTGAVYAMYGKSTQTVKMETGHSYIVPIQSWGYYLDDYRLSNKNTITDLFFISHDAIVTPEESGKYKVTIQVENYEQMVTYQIFKQGSFAKKTNKSDVKCGSVGLDGYKHKEKMQELGLMDESNNDKLYQSNEIEITPIDGTTNKYLTFEVDNLEDHLYTYWVKSADYGWCTSADRQSVLWKSDLGFDTANITSLPASLSDYKNGGAFFDIVSDKNKYPHNQEKDGQVLNNLVNVTVTVDSSSASVKLQSDQIKELYSCGTPETVTPGSGPERYRNVSDE